MPHYHVQFQTDAEWAQAHISAESADHAFARAAAFDVSGLVFEPFTPPRSVREITITNEHGDAWVWRDEETLLRLAADELLIAAKNVLAALQGSFTARWSRVAPSTLGHLEDTAAPAEGRAL